LKRFFVEILMGRKPKPSALKLLNGNPGKRPLNPAEPMYEVDDELSPPDDLDAEALSEWIRCAPLLRDAGVLTQIDRTALAALYMCYSRWIDAERHVRRDGCVISGSTGSPVMNPYVRVAAQALDQMRALMGDFGMTPSSRSRLRAESTGERQDDLEKELFG
jgi:P27 family predicted phage terminase small subunit